jgi:hypothetical protein
VLSLGVGYTSKWPGLSTGLVDKKIAALVEGKLRVRQFQTVRGGGDLPGRRFPGELRNALLACGYAR